MTRIAESEIQAKHFADTGEKRGEILAKTFADFRPLIRKILAPIKIKLALPPPKKKPKYPPLKRIILWTWFFLQNGRFFPGVHKIGAAISGPRIVDKNFTDTRIFRSLISRKSGRKKFIEKSHIQISFTARFWEWEGPTKVCAQSSFSVYEQPVQNQQCCLFTLVLNYFNSVQIGRIVKGTAQKSPLHRQHSKGFWFSQLRLFSRNFTLSLEI